MIAASARANAIVAMRVESFMADLLISGRTRELELPAKVEFN
jgi:hypothetical protein